MQGEDPKMEKFSKFLEGHIKVLPDRGAFVSLWFLSLQEMTKEENFERVKKSFGRRFPVGLEDKDYETIYAKLEKDHLVNILAEKPVAYIAWTKRKFLNARKIDWYAEGL
jgi:hypothetical protein